MSCALDNVVSVVQRHFDFAAPEHLLSPEWWHTTVLLFGLNNEHLDEQPPEYSSFFGGGLGLRIWQYPNQIAPYLAYISRRAQDLNSYLEIGARYGGTFILHAELFRKLNPQFHKAVALDLIDPDELLRAYLRANPVCEYRQGDSRTVPIESFDLVMIDGDHNWNYILNDVTRTIDAANTLVFHDITNIACPDVKQFWAAHREQYARSRAFHEFTEQYMRVRGPYLGIGVSEVNNKE